MTGQARAAIQEPFVYTDKGAIWKSSGDGSSATQLTTPSPWLATPRLSSDGEKIVYIDYDGFAIYVMNSDGSGRSTVFTAPSGRQVMHPRFSPDGTKIIFTYRLKRNDLTTEDIYAIGVNGSGLTPLITWRGAQEAPTYSPNGQTILFATLTDPKGRALGGGERQLWKASNQGGATGTAVTTYGANPYGASHPVYSPDGLRLAYQSTAPGAKTNIFTMNADGQGGALQVTHNNSASGATWSPDGKRIAYETQRDDPIYFRSSIWAHIVGTNDELRLRGLEAQSPSYRQPGGISASDRLARDYRPHLLFDEGERWRPLEIRAFLGETHEICYQGACEIISTPEQLRSYPYADAYINVDGSGGEDQYRSPVAECNQPASTTFTQGLQDCDTGLRSKIYYNVSQPSPSGYQYLDYWFFYRYNDVPDISQGDHEADWESVSVAPSPGEQPTFDFASFSGHGRWYSYLRDNLSCDGAAKGSCGTETGKTGRRVNSFVATGSHANYGEACLGPCTQTNSPLYEGGHSGSRPWGNNNDPSAVAPLPPVAGREQPWTSGPQEWTDWPGDWSGSDQQIRGPAGGDPNRAHFFEPWYSDCADGSSCPPQFPTSVSSASPSSSTDARGTSACSSWFGPAVVALACDEGRLSTSLAKRQLGREGQLAITDPSRGKQGAAAPGITQIVGGPLKPGGRLLLRGRATRETELFIRVRAGNGGLYQARFLVGPMTSDEVVALHNPKAPAGKSSGAPALSISSRNGRRGPVDIERVRSAAHPRP